MMTLVFFAGVSLGVALGFGVALLKVPEPQSVVRIDDYDGLVRHIQRRYTMGYMIDAELLLSDIGLWGDVVFLKGPGNQGFL